MNETLIKALNVGRRIHSKLTQASNKSSQPYGNAELSGQASSDYIKNLLLSEQPCMIARFGSGELACTLNSIGVKQTLSFQNGVSYIKGKSSALWWEESVVQGMVNNAGFFPRDLNLLEQFGDLMIQDMQQVDVLGAWLAEEKLFQKELSNAKMVRLPDLEPYYHKDPWSSALEGKKVLVVHPYEDSIRMQYARRKFLFQDARILPDFNLLTLKAVQSIADSKTDFKNWFEALDFMKDKISQLDFDIAIIGCGAYGFPLAAHVKRLGKKSIHLGGATQILFGIKGKRWEELEVVSDLMNEYWVKPLPSETPKKFTQVEGGCYW